jgi:pimeloyl-ACP methyl ester carboxylesterase
MPEAKSGDVRISYETAGEGRPLMLLHGWCCDRSWWTEPGYVGELASDHRLVQVDIRGHGASDKPHEATAYTSDALISDVFAVADAERLDRFAIWGQSYGGWIAWMTAAAAPHRIPAIVASGAWDPRPEPEEPTEVNAWDEALRHGGTRAPVDRFKIEDGATFNREFPPWAQAVTLRADPEALLAAHAPERWTDGIPDDDLRSFPVPALLIAGELEDENDDAAKVAAMIPNGESLRLPDSGTGGPALRVCSRLPLSGRSSTAGSRGDRTFRRLSGDGSLPRPKGKRARLRRSRRCR